MHYSDQSCAGFKVFEFAEGKVEERIKKCGWTQQPHGPVVLHKIFFFSFFWTCFVNILVNILKYWALCIFILRRCCSHFRSIISVTRFTVQDIFLIRNPLLKGQFWKDMCLSAEVKWITSMITQTVGFARKVDKMKINAVFQNMLKN